MFRQLTPVVTASYGVRVPWAVVLPRASFRFRLTTDTLASGYRAGLPNPGRTFTDKLPPMPGVRITAAGEESRRLSFRLQVFFPHSDAVSAAASPHTAKSCLHRGSRQSQRQPGRSTTAPALAGRSFLSQGGPLLPAPVWAAPTAARANRRRPRPCVPVLLPPGCPAAARAGAAIPVASGAVSCGRRRRLSYRSLLAQRPSATCTAPPRRSR